ncbi:MAG: DegV family protein [Ilumatobacteraceae bacterium]
MIGICTDSGSQLPADLAKRLGIEVVPLTVTVDDQEYLEGVGADAARLHELLAVVPAAYAVSSPSPGQFAAAYEDLVDRGCTAVLSVHSGLSGCNTISAARLAAHALSVPVRLVSSPTVSFGVGCCAWVAAEAVTAGATLEEAGQAVEALAPNLRHVLMPGAIVEDAGDLTFPIFSGLGDEAQPLASVPSVIEAAMEMSRFVLATLTKVRVGIGSHGPSADRLAGQLADHLAQSLGMSELVVDLVRYPVSAGAAQRAPAGAVGCFVFPAG